MLSDGAAWRKPSHSGHSNCAEVGQDGTVVLVRDTEERDGPVLRFGAAQWMGFVTELKKGG
jgi:hypothetical protein